MPDLVPHHDGSPLHVSTSAPALGDVVMVRLRVPTGYPALAAVRTLSNPDHEPEWTDAQLIGSADGWDWWTAPLTVRNPRHGYRWVLQHRSGVVEWINQAGVHSLETRDADDFVLIARPEPPAWLAEAVTYQIFPDRFARSPGADERATPEWAVAAQWQDPVDPVMPGRSQQFYGGDLDGIVDRLDHIAALGVNLIYLTPVFPAASNHRYDASSFDRVDPLLGGDGAYIRFVEAAHARGIRVLGDLTVNHSGDQHEWFQAALGDPAARETEFYYFTDSGNTEYVSWLGTPTLPKFDWSSDELRRRFIEGPGSVVGAWLRPPFNLDGWRIDVANMTGRLGEIDLNHEVRSTIRRTMSEVAPDTIVVAEITNDVSTDLQGDGWDGAMTYSSFTRPLWAWLSEPSGTPYTTADGDERTQPWFFGQPIGGIPRYSARQFVDAVVRFTAGLPWRMRAGLMQALDSHDTARFATNAAAGTIAVAVGLTMTLPGMPVVFAGDEFGLTGVDGEMSRTPMPWGSEDLPPVAARMSLYRDLIALRRGHPALSTGGLRWVHVEDHGLMFIRESEQECVLVLATRGDFRAQVSAASLPGIHQARALFGQASIRMDADDVEVSADGACFAAWALRGVAAPPDPLAESRHDEQLRDVVVAGDERTPAEIVEAEAQHEGRS